VSAPASSRRKVTLRIPSFVVIGGGENGVFYVRQLLRAQSAGALDTDHVVVVDRAPRCLVSHEVDPRVTLEVADWSEWLDANLDRFSPADHVVPYHWAPHLFLDWLSRQAERAGATAVRGAAPLAPAGVPFARACGPGDLALSYATWTCPATCIEPALCPHTRGDKDWSLCADLEAARPGLDATGSRAAGLAATTSIVFRCLHLVYGVGTVPVSALFEARRQVLAGLATGPQSYLVATSSHCHALAATLEVRPA
jgi:hypothetical protein